jgi:hypothetical protein
LGAAYGKTVVRFEIGHYHMLPTTETDEAKCQSGLRLLAEEEARMIASTGAPWQPKDIKTE